MIPPQGFYHVENEATAITCFYLLNATFSQYKRFHYKLLIRNYKNTNIQIFNIQFRRNDLKLN